MAQRNEELRNDGAGEPDAPWICYWLVTSGEDDDQTPFQAFSSSVVTHEFRALIELVAVLPASLFEIFAHAGALPRARTQLVRKRASIMGVGTLTRLQRSQSFQGVLQVIVAPSDVMGAARAAVGDGMALFVSIENAEGVIGLADHDGHPAQLLDEAFYRVLLNALTEGDRQRLAAFKRREPWFSEEEGRLVTGVTHPNWLLASSLGVDLEGDGAIDGGQERAYERAIIDSASQCAEVIGDYANEYILFAPSLIRQLYGFESAFWNRLMRAIPDRRVRRFVKDAVFRNKAYSGFPVPEDQADVFDALAEDPVGSGLLGLRQSELWTTSAAIGSLASTLLAPALRLPNAVNFHGAALRDIETFAQRTDAVGARRLQQVFGELADSLRDEIDAGIRDQFADPSTSLILVSDAPVEWARIDGLPLMIRHEMSRISSTPGNLMLQQCVESSLTTIASHELYDVLVVRSFEPSDPIRTMIERGVALFKLKRMRMRIVDVASQQDVVDALNAFDGKLVVFDCHGGHGGEEGHGWLMIGATRLDPWSLAHVARIPPIVILSACSTFALAGSHASVGNGFLRSGARTVIGTFLPVDAVGSTAFVCRLLYRIEAFLPALRAMKMASVTWRTFVSVFLRMSYTTDILRFLETKKGWIDAKHHRDIGSATNERINLLRPDWYDWMMARLAEASNRPESEIRAAIIDDHPLMETLLYCQLGRPDAVLIDLAT